MKKFLSALDQLARFFISLLVYLSSLFIDLLNEVDLSHQENDELNVLQNYIAWFSSLLSGRKMGFIKSTDHRPTDYRPTDHRQLTHRPTDHRPTDPSSHRPNNHRPNNKIIFKRLDDWEIFILQNTNAAGKIKNTFPFI